MFPDMLPGAGENLAKIEIVHDAPFCGSETETQLFN
jgi:hypothetical protein